MLRKTKTILGLAMALGMATTGGCYTSDFTQTGQYAAQLRDPSAVQVMTARPAGGYREVGLITCSGTKLETALARGREEAASHGCDAVVLIGEALESGRGVPGSAYGMTRDNLRLSCLVRTAEVASQ